jgi:hypothetical protein
MTDVHETWQTHYAIKGHGRHAFYFPTISSNYMAMTEFTWWFFTVS